MAGYDYSRPATKSEPCAICGKEHHCYTAYWGNRGFLRYCAGSTAPTVYGRDGEYYLKRETAGYSVYELVSQREALRQAYIEEQQRLNPNYWYSSRQPRVAVAAPIPEKPVVEIGTVEPLSNDRLHQVYSYLLSLLVLEDNHKKALLDEWNAGAIRPTLGDELLQKWPIKSLPMVDRARKACGIRLKNRTRREIIDALVKKFGSLEGVPGFFLETSRSIDRVTGKQMENTHWQMVGLSGIVYPCYDVNGNIYRIRIGDEHPAIKEYKKDSNGAIIYEEKTSRVYQNDGSFTEKKVKTPTYCADYRWDYKTGEWSRTDRDSGKEEIVYSIQKGIYKVALSDKGYPKVDGKTEGKYKNFSSYFRKEKELDDKIIVFNGYESGCQSNSPVSIYMKKGDNMQFVYITEGEKKGMVINACLNCPVICLPGVHTSSKIFDVNGDGKSNLQMSLMSYLMSLGLKAIIVVYDADKATNDAVLAAEKAVITKCKEQGVLVLSANWSPLFGKGADDVLIAGKTFEYYQW